MPRTFLWEISGNGLAGPSYLFGTTHLICESDIEMPEILRQKIAGAKEVFLETAPTSKNDSSSKVIFMGSDTTLKDLIGRSYYRKIKNILAASKPIKEEVLNRIKPFHVGRLIDIASIKCKPVSYESVIIKIARTEKIPINGLENAKEHAGVVDNIPLTIQAQQLKAQVDKLELRIKAIEQSMELYKQKEVLQLYYKAAYNGNYQQSKFKTSFLDERNMAWVPKIMAVTQKGSAFFAFGCAHLVGEVGVINLLRKQGFTVSPVFYEQ